MFGYIVKLFIQFFVDGLRYKDEIEMMFYVVYLKVIICVISFREIFFKIDKNDVLEFKEISFRYFKNYVYYLIY